MINNLNQLLNADDERMISVQYYMRKRRRERAIAQQTQAVPEETTLALSGDEA